MSSVTTKSRKSATVTSDSTVTPTKTLHIPSLELAEIAFTIHGTSGLIVHAFSKKQREAMLDKQMGRASAGREMKVPFRDFVESLYWLTPMPQFDYTAAQSILMDQFYMAVKKGAKFGFPAIGVKAAMVTACTSLASMTKVAARQAFHIDQEYIEIEGVPEMREDTVRIGQGTTDLRYRPEFKQWSAVVPITYNKRVITDEQLANILNTAGFAVGIGDYRPERDGSNGRFTITNG